MNKFFYGKLAFGNLRKNGRLYLPYILAAVGIGAMYYIMVALTGDKGIEKMPGGGNTTRSTATKNRSSVLTGSSVTMAIQ